MDIRAAEISAILKKQIKDFGKEAQDQRFVRIETTIHFPIANHQLATLGVTCFVQQQYLPQSGR